MKTVIRRIRRLEDQFKPAIQADYLRNPRERMRLVVSAMGQPLSLPTSTCMRTLCEIGVLMELVTLEGASDDLTDDELEQFVAGFPVRQLGAESKMKAITRRIRRLEETLTTAGDGPAYLRSWQAATVLYERQRHRAEAEGRPFDRLPPAPPPSCPCRTLSVAETLRQARQRFRERVQAAPPTRPE